MLPVVLLAAACVPMAIEAARSSRNERTLRVMGAVEPPGDVYRLMQIVYPACFLAMIVEAWARGRGASAVAVSGAVVFAGAKALKYWAIAALGFRWSFRVLVPPHAVPVRSGPYRFLAHPNYVAVAGELAGMALMAQAPWSGALSIAVFGALMLARVRVEERALGVR